MIGRMFEALFDLIKACFSWLGELVVKLIVYTIGLFQDLFTWITEEWIRGWMEVLEFVLTLIPHTDMGEYTDVIIQLRLYWAQFNNLLPLNTALYCALVYIDVFNLVQCLKFVNLIFSKFFALAKFVIRFIGM